MRLKYYLRGFGIGIIFATTILFIVYSFNMSDNKIKEKAKELGMIVAGESETKETKESESTKEPASTKETESTKELESQTKEPESTTPEPTTPEPTTQEQPTKEPSKQSVTLVITSGMTSDTVAKKLKELGAIDDVQGFDNYLIKNGHAERIHVGSFEIPAGSDFKKIAEIIAK